MIDSVAESEKVVSVKLWPVSFGFLVENDRCCCRSGAISVMVRLPSVG